MCASIETARELLVAAQTKGIDPSLEPVRAMLDELGSPDARYDAIQIVGTNGKTSTARYLASILRGKGLGVGLFLSPCLVDYLDQIEVNGKVVGQDEFAQAVVDAAEAGRAVNRARAARREEPLPNTEFDLLTVAALLLFSRRGVDVAVLEAGMGGKWDATSAATCICEVGATGIGMDHTGILGSTYAQIAQQKAAVIQGGRRCVLGAGVLSNDSAREVFFSRCREQGVVPTCVLSGGNKAKAPYMGSACTFQIERRPKSLGEPLCLQVDGKHGSYNDLRVQKPVYQAQNIACAIALAEEYVGRPLREDALAESLASCKTPGRFEVLQRDPLVLLDACHNPQSVRAFVEALDGVVPEVRKRPTLLCAIFADKDVASMVRLLASAFPRVVVTRTSSRRAMDPHDLAEVFRGCGLEPAGVYDCVADAVDALRDEPFVACGSITTAGEVAHILRYAPKGDDNVRA